MKCITSYYIMQWKLISLLYTYKSFEIRFHPFPLLTFCLLTTRHYCLLSIAFLLSPIVYTQSPVSHSHMCLHFSGPCDVLVSFWSYMCPCNIWKYIYFSMIQLCVFLFEMSTKLNTNKTKIRISNMLCIACAILNS